MTNQDVINFLNQVRKILLDDKSWLESTIQSINEAFDKAISVIQAQDSKTRKNCDTCKHDPPSKKWPCADCDMRDPADRWEPKDVPDTNVGDMVSRQALCEYALNQKNKSVTPNDIMRFPSAQQDQYIKEKSVDIGYLHDWYQNSVTDDPPVWTDEHIKEMFCDFYMIPRQGKEREEIMNEFDRTSGGD